MVKKKEKTTTKEEIKTQETKRSFDFKKINYWMVLSIALAIIILINIFVSYNSGISSKTAEKEFIEFAKLQGVNVEVTKIEKKGNLYEITFELLGQEGKYYMTTDGKYIGQMFELNEIKKTLTTGDSVSNSERNSPTEVPKSDKPKLELFVMTHCPFGTQAEKGFIPFIEAFGKNVDSKIRFVHYFMHGQKEEDETYRQLCIREEQNDKYINYLKEFLKEGDSKQAGIVAGIDESKVSECIKKGNAKKYYEEDSKLSKQYGVQGSPTLVVNGVEASSGRSPAAYLQTACSAFNTAPTECSTLTLSTQTPSPGFGWSTSTNSNSAAQCG